MDRARVVLRIDLRALTLLALVLLGCGPSCPRGTAPDRGWEGALRARLSTVDPALAATAAPVCVGEVPEDGVTEDGLVLLDRGGSEAARAARLGHLLLHVREPVRIAAGPACEADLERAVSAEREALAAEDTWRAAWSEPPLPPTALEARRAAYTRRCHPGRVGSTREAP